MFSLNESIVPEYTKFVFGVSVDTSFKEVKELIHYVTEFITTETSLKKDIPTIPIIMEQLVYKS
ncbi:MAG: hypothetical protein C5B45_04825 [Chlamydiae bacterium]|nr:MAG: hypothetical protein C5B45_04825 [Chlamydiota bacterium]